MGYKVKGMWEGEHGPMFHGTEWELWFIKTSCVFGNCDNRDF